MITQRVSSCRSLENSPINHCPVQQSQIILTLHVVCVPVCRCHSTCPHQNVAGEITVRSRPLCLSCPSLSVPVPPAACHGRARPWRTVRYSVFIHKHQHPCQFKHPQMSFCARVELLPAPLCVQDISSEPRFTRTVLPTASRRLSHWTPASDQRRRSQVKQTLSFHFLSLHAMKSEGGGYCWST